MFSFLSDMPGDWLGRMSSKLVIFVCSGT